MTSTQKIVVINGSPKGNKLSVTIQYCKYLKNRYPRFDFEFIPVGKKINKIKRDASYFHDILKSMKQAAGIVWAFPVYLMLIPSQLKEFIELLFEYQAQESTQPLKDKYVTTLSTSAKFYDHTAHQYITLISQDLGLQYVPGYSAEMTDLMEKEEQHRLKTFWEYFIHYINSNLCPITQPKNSIDKKTVFFSPQSEAKIQPLSFDPQDTTHQAVIITDIKDNDSNLGRMLATFREYLPFEAKVINIHDIQMVSGCRGCLRCAFTNQCVIQDEHLELFQKDVVPADIIIYTLHMQDRYFSARFKQFMDRTFSNGHRPVFKDQKQVWLISTEHNKQTTFQNTPYLAELIQAHAEIGRASLIGIVTDESSSSNQITQQLKTLAQDLIWSLEHQYTKPKTFLGEGGHKVFRDLIYSYKFLFRQDYTYYKKENLLDWPKDAFGLLGKLLTPLMWFKNFRKEFLAKANQQMVKRYESVVNVSQD